MDHEFVIWLTVSLVDSWLVYALEKAGYTEECNYSLAVNHLPHLQSFSHLCIQLVGHSAL